MKRKTVTILNSDYPRLTDWVDVCIEYWHGSKATTRSKREYWPCILSREHLVRHIETSKIQLAHNLHLIEKGELSEAEEMIAADKADIEKDIELLALVDKQGYAYKSIEDEDALWERASDLYVRDKHISVRVVEKAIKLLVEKVHKKGVAKVKWKEYPVNYKRNLHLMEMNRIWKEYI